MSRRSTTSLRVLRPDQAAAAMAPVRLRLLGHLRTPNSASGLAGAMGMPRQKVNYHLRELERVGLVELVEERKKRNLTERVVRATASSYVIDPGVLGSLGAEAAKVGAVEDRFSSAYLLATCAESIRDVAAVRAAAEKRGKKVATLTARTEVRFSSPAAMNAFAEELLTEFARLAKKHHADDGPGSAARTFVFSVTGYPKITDTARVQRDSLAAGGAESDAQEHAE